MKTARSIAVKALRDANNFKLFNRQTNEKETLGDNGIRSIELVSAYGTSLRGHLSRPPHQLSPAQIDYKLAVQKLAVDKHRLVHCDLPHRKVHTGVMTQIADQGFLLEGGILNSRWIPYADLQASPRPVPAIGTRIGRGFQ
jgi:hypothetical protein